MTCIPFINYSSSQGFHLTPQTESFLSSISQTPVAVLSIVGNYRTGKSFFINRVLLNKSNGQGFTVGPSINPCTKGLWLWSEPLEHQNPDLPKDVKVLLIDTEGFGGIDQDLSHNSRIGLISLLLSSFFIYNSLGIIDENSLNSLSLIVSLGQEIMKQGESSGIFPSFLWVLRDFALQMLSSEGVPISHKDYLEKALDFTPKMPESKIKSRKVIREIFSERDCFTMVRPVANERDLQKLDNLDEKNLRPEFSEQIKRARHIIFSRIKPKKINGKVITAGLLLELCRNFITVINGEKIPNIQSTWVYLCRNQMNATFSACMAFVEIEYDKLKTLELISDELSKQNSRIKSEVKEKLERNLKGLCEKEEYDQVYRKIKDFLKSQADEMTSLMNDKTQRKTLNFLDERLQSLKNTDLKDFSSEFNKIQEFFKTKKLLDPEILTFYDCFFKNCLEAYEFELRNVKKTVTKLSDQKLLMLEQDIQAKKMQFSKEKESLERKIIESETKLQSQIKKNQASRKSTFVQTIETMNNSHQESLETMKKEMEKLLQERNAMAENINMLASEKSKALEVIESLKADINDLKNSNMLAIQTNYDPQTSAQDPAANSSNLKDFKNFKEQEGELMHITNRALTMTLEKSEEQTRLLTNKIQKLKEYKQLFKNSSQFQCKVCQKFFSSGSYQDHCRQEKCVKDKEIINIYSSLNDLPDDSKSLNISNINIPAVNTNNDNTESQLICEEILSPLKEHNVTSKKHLQKHELMFQKKKKENLEDLIERLNRNDKYSVLHAKRLELLSPKISTPSHDYKSTLKKEHKKPSPRTEKSSNHSNRVMTLPQNAWDSSENKENPCSQRFDSMNFLFQSMRNCDILARKVQEDNFAKGNNRKLGTNFHVWGNK